MPNQQSTRHENSGNPGCLARFNCNDSRQSFGFVTTACGVRPSARRSQARPRSCLSRPRVATTGLIRYRLLSIVLLGVVTSALSLYALERALSTSMSVRRQKAHDIVTAEVDRLAAATPSADTLEAGAITTYLGVRGGWVKSPADLARAKGLPPEWLPTLADAIGRADLEHSRVLAELDQSPNTVV